MRGMRSVEDDGSDVVLPDGTALRSAMIDMLVTMGQEMIRSGAKVRKLTLAVEIIDPQDDSHVIRMETSATPG